MKYNGCSDGPNSEVEVDVAKSEGHVALKLTFQLTAQ